MRFFSQKKSERKSKVRPRRTFRQWLRRVFWRSVLGVSAFVLFAVSIYTVLNPPITPYIWSERSRLGSVDREWVPIEEIAPAMARSVVAAEDANFCLHWGLDTTALREALEQGAVRGGSTISQQVVKNVYLWHGRSWVRKGIETLLTPVVEAIWTKRRILEVYLNIAEFDEGVFGVEAAAYHYFGVGPVKLTPMQAARLAAILPNPKVRSASRPSNAMRSKAARVMDGAATIRADGRAFCFED